MPDFIVRRLDKTSCTVDVYVSGRLQCLEDDPWSTAYVAFSGNRIIGSLTICRKKRKDQKTISSRATGIRPTNQRQGVAKALWTAMIKAEKPTKIIVTTVSNKGFTLVDAMQDAFPRIKWAVDGGGNRSLRSKKRG